MLGISMLVHIKVLVSSLNFCDCPAQLGQCRNSEIL